MKWAVSPVTWHAGNDWAGCCGITTDNKLPDLPIQKWRRTTNRSMSCVQETAPLFFTKAKMQALCLAAGKRSPTPSLSTEIAPLCQFQSSERDAFPGHPSIFTLREFADLVSPDAVTIELKNATDCSDVSFSAIRGVLISFSSKLVAGIVDVPELRLTRPVGLRVMNDEEQLPFEGSEKHAVSGVVALEGILLLHPGTLNTPRRRIGDTLRVAMLAPTRPQHSQLARLGPEHLWSVGHPSRHLQTESCFADAVHLLRPRRFAGAEDGSWLGGATSEVLRERHVGHRTVDELGPLVDEDHVSSVVFLVKRAVDDIPVPGTEAELEFGHKRLVRPVGCVGHQQLRLVGRNVVPARDIFDQVTVIVPGARQVVLVSDVMDFGCSHEVFFHPRPLEVDDGIRASPNLQVLAFVETPASARQVICVRLLVSIDEGVAH